MPRLVDSHCHLDAAAFDDDREAVLQRAHQAGVQQLLIPAVDAASWPRIAALCQAHSGLFAAWGLHPMFLHRHQPAHLDLLRTWLTQRRPVAVGECGLDYWDGALDAQNQRRYFTAQLHLAREFDLPVIIHARKAVDEVIASLRRVGGLRGVVHSFSGSAQQADQLHRLGFLLGFGGPLTYERAKRLRALVAEVPDTQLLLESDAPDQPDAALRGQRNEPARLLQVAEVVAELRGQTLEQVARQTSDNSRRVFGLPAISELPTEPPTFSSKSVAH